MKTLWFMVSVFVLFLFHGCDEPETDQNTEIIFQFEYINYAWSFQHRGFLIDKEGKILSFEKPAGWIFPENNSITTKDLINNLNKALKISGQVELKKLEEMTEIALGISNESLTKPENRMADAGTEGYYFFRLNSETRKYERTTLLQRGDWSQENKGKDADTVIKWLLEINKGGMYNF